MATLSIRIPDDLYTKLLNLSEQTDRKKSYIVRRAIEEFIQDEEDYIDSIGRLRANEATYSLSEIGLLLDLDHSH